MLRKVTQIKTRNPKTRNPLTNPRLPIMKTAKILLSLSLLALTPHLSNALIVGPYTPDANTLHLYHFNEAATPCVDSATSGGTNLTYMINGGTLGGAGYATGFTNAITFGSFTASNAVIFPIGSGNVGTPIPFTYAGTSGAFTYEALLHIEFNVTNYFRAQPCQIFNCDADSTGTRTLQFRIDPVGYAGGATVGGANDTNRVRIEFINGTATVAMVPIPTNGPDVIVSNNWYHIAVTYNGTPNTTSNLLFYWTLLDPSRSTADCIWGTNMAANLPNTYTGTTIFSIGNGARNPSGGSGPVLANFMGKIDEFRISKIARAANQMMFAPATVAITQQPIGQEGVDYGSTGVLTVSATSAVTPLYQWWQNATPLAGATNTTYSFTNATLANGGNYFCVITNASGSSITSSVASVVIGAANFLTNRYSFATDGTDSIGGQNGTVNGGVTFNGNGTMTLDGSSGYIQLPSNIINTNAGAVTIETWASFGTIANNSQLFAFGNTNGTSGYNYIFSTPHGSAARAAITAGNYTSEQGAAAGIALDNFSGVQIVAVFAPYANTLSFYTNGVLAAVNTNATLPLSSVIDAFSFIGKSLYSGDPYLAGTIDEFRIYNGALSAASVQQSYLQGPNTILSDGPVAFLASPTNITVAQGQTVTFGSFAEGHQPIIYQWLKNGTPIAGATNSAYSYAPTFGDNNATFQLLATNTIGGTNYSASTSTATLTVLVPATLAWLGASDNYWNTSSLDWSNAAQQVVAYVQFDGVVFDDRGAGQPSVDLQAAFSPVSIIASNNAANYVLYSSAADGSLSGPGSISVLGSGTLTLDVTNYLTGATLVQNGTLQIGNSDTYGNLSGGTFTNNASVVFDRTDALVVTNDLHGSGSFTVAAGTVVLNSTNSDYSGATWINNGILNLANVAGLGNTNGATTVGSGAQLYVTVNANIGLEGLTLAGSGADGSGSLRKGGAGGTTDNGPVFLSTDATIGVDGGATLNLASPTGVVGTNANLTFNGSGTASVNGPLSLGSGALTVNILSSGNLILNSSNKYAGGTTLTAGVIQANTNGVFGTGSIYANSGSAVGRILLGTGTILTNAVTADTVNPAAANGLLMVADNTNGTVTTVSGPLVFNANSTAGGHFIGPVTSGYLNVSGPVTMPDGTFMVIRTGNIRFSGNGYYPQIQVRANTTSIGAVNGIATNAVMDIGGNGSATAPTYFDLNGYSQTLAGLKNTVTPANVGWVTNSSATTASLNLALGTGNSLSFGGGIVGNLSLALASGQQTLTTNGSALSGLYTYTGNTTINGGTLSIGVGAVWTNTPVINVAAGATLDVTATGVALARAQTLEGSGLVSGEFTNNGTIAPGLTGSLGNLTFNNDLTLLAPSVTAVKVNATLATNDTVAVAGTITYAGTLAVTKTGTLTAGTSFPLFSAPAWTGNFAGVTGSPGAGLGYVFNPTNGVLSVVATVATNPTNITYSVNGGSLVLSWPADHLGWTLQAQTNSLSKGIGTNWVTVAGSTAVTGVTNAINTANGAVFYRLILP